jgi:uncharacterized glyoxalase superfamily protein PhnB
MRLFMSNLRHDARKICADVQVEVAGVQLAAFKPSLQDQGLNLFEPERRHRWQSDAGDSHWSPHCYTGPHADNAAKAIRWYGGCLWRERSQAARRRRTEDPTPRSRSATRASCSTTQSWAKKPKALGGSPAQLWIYVEDCDTLFKRALAAGAHVFGGATGELTDQFWGDRSGTVVDPFGFKWSIATRKEDLSPKEMERRQSEFMKDFAVQSTSG